MQDIAPWTVCDAQIREDPTKKVTNISRHNSTSYGFLAPFFDGDSYSGSTVRLKLATTMQEVRVTRTWINIMTCCVVNITREICALNRTEVRDSGAVRITTIDEYATASIEVNNTLIYSRRRNHRRTLRWRRPPTSPRPYPYQPRHPGRKPWISRRRTID